MPNRRGLITGAMVALLAVGAVLLVRWSPADERTRSTAADEKPKAALPPRPYDAVAEAQTPKEVPVERPEQKKTAHDLSDSFTSKNAKPSSEALVNQPEGGRDVWV